MKAAVPPSAKIAKDAKECVQECVSEFISFITSEAAEKCQMEKRKTIGGEDILYAMSTLGFENYGEVLKIHLAKLRAVCRLFALFVDGEPRNADVAHRVGHRRPRVQRLSNNRNRHQQRSDLGKESDKIKQVCFCIEPPVNMACICVVLTSILVSCCSFTSIPQT